MANRTVVIYFDQPGKLDAPFSEPMYLASYRDFAHYAKSQGMDVLIARGDSYLGNAQFKNCWQFDGDELVQIDLPITADLIYMKSLKPSFELESNVLVVNDPEFEKSTNSKWAMYELFSEFMPQTYLISSNNWETVRDQIPTDKIVLKPTEGLGGKGVIITDKATLDFPSLNLGEQYIAQPFVDSSHGIPGVCTSYHDLRILFFNNEPKLSFIRVPKAGSLLSNISQGASAAVVDVERIPSEIIDMAKAVDQRYAKYTPRHYTADFFMGQDRPYLVETNTQPGFPRADAEGEEFQGKYYQYLYQLFEQAIQSKQG